MYILKAENGKTASVQSDVLKKYIEDGKVYLTNMTLTSNGSLVDQFRHRKKDESNSENNSQQLKFFNELKPLEPFVYRIKFKSGDSGWKQAIYLGFLEESFKFVDESEYCDIQAFQRKFLESHNNIEFSKRINDSIKIEKLLNKAKKLKL